MVLCHMPRATAVLALLLATASLFASTDIAEPGYGPAYGMSPVTASNGTNFLTVWNGGLSWLGSIADADGATVTPIPFVIAPTSNFFDARLVPVGENYYLIGKSNSGAARIATISSTGQVTADSPGLHMPAALTRPAIASSGDRIVVADRTPSNIDRAVYVNFFDREGTFLSRTEIATADSWSVAWSGSEFVVATAEPSSIVLYRFTRDGISAGRRVVAPQPYTGVSVVVAANAEGSLVAWNELGSTIIKTAGVPNSGNNATLLTLTRNVRVLSLSIASFGSSYLLAESYTTGAAVTRFSSDGVVIAGPVPVIAAESVASNGRIGFVAGSRAAVRSTVVRLGNPLNVERTAILSMAQRRQDAEEIASNGLDFLALWRNSDALSAQSYARQLDRNGTPTSPLVAGPEDRALADSGMAFATSIYLSIYLNSNYELHAQRFTAGGDRLGEPITIAKRAYYSAVTAAGDRFYVTWTDDRNETYGAFVSPDGSVSQPALLASNSRSSHAHKVAFNGKVVLVLLQFPSMSFIGPFVRPGDVRALRVSTSGVRLDAEAVIVQDDVYQASIASNGRDFLVVADSSYRSTLTRIVADETTLTIGVPKAFFSSTGNLVQSDISWDGTEYVVAWRSSSLGLARADVSGNVREAKRSDQTTTSLASLFSATNTLGDVAILVTEQVEDPRLARARVYTQRDFLKPLTIPAPPADLTVGGTSSARTVRWSYDGPPVVRFLVQSVTAYTTFTKEVPASARSVDVLGVPHEVRVIAVAESGMAASASLDLNTSRRRTAGR